MYKKLFFMIFLIISASNAADVFMYCNGSGGNCYLDHVLNVASPTDSLNFIDITYGPVTNPVVQQLTTLEFKKNSNIEFFPTNLLQLYPTVQFIIINHCQLTYLTTDSFKYCDQVEQIGGAFLPLKYIPAGFARSCPKITHVSFILTDIEYIDVNAFEGLSQLTTVYLDDNKLKCIPSNIFASNNLISHIRFDSNQLTALDPNMVRHLNNLWSFRLSNNSISYIPAINMDLDPTGKKSFFFINLQDNPVVAINPDIFNTLFKPNVSARLNLGNYLFNHNTCIPPEYPEVQYGNLTYDWDTIFSSCYSQYQMAYVNDVYSCINPPLTTPSTSTTTTTTTTTTTSTAVITTRPPFSGVCASDKICRYYVDFMDRYTCVIDGVEGTLTSISGTHISSLYNDASVTRVYFTNSFMSRVPPVVFSKFINVDFISVANCSLGMIIDGTLSFCGHMTYLDASNNEIFHISPTALGNCTSLQTLDLSGNPIDQINRDLFQFGLKRIILN